MAVTKHCILSLSLVAVRTILGRMALKKCKQCESHVANSLLMDKRNTKSCGDTYQGTIVMCRSGVEL